MIPPLAVTATYPIVSALLYVALFLCGGGGGMFGPALASLANVLPEIL